MPFFSPAVVYALSHSSAVSILNFASDSRSCPARVVAVGYHRSFMKEVAPPTGQTGTLKRTG